MTRTTPALLALFLFTTQLFAQISSGGEPLSFALSLDEAPASLTMPELDISAYLAEDEAEDWGEVAPRFGAPHDVAINLNNSGTWTQLRDGRLWRCRIVSSGAYSINLQLDEFFMPPGARLFIYNDDRSHIIGAFTERNNKKDGRLGTQPVKGDAITLEYFEPETQTGQGRLSIWRVVHAYRNMFDSGILDDFGEAAWCSVNINCPEGDDWQDEKRGVAMIIADNGFRWCSGTLINNVRNDGTPYFHTAKHCTDGQNVGAWVFIFGYESPGCDVVDGPLDHSVSSGTLLFTHIDTDVALIEISEAIPLEYNPYFNGWYVDDIAPENSTCISHPATDVMKIGIDDDPAISASFGGTPQGSHWRVQQWDVGHCEHGSSGSPLFNQDGLIIGQCHGGDGWCDDVTFHNVDFGKLGWSFDLGVDQWLDPDVTGTEMLMGYDPNDAGIVTGIVTNADTHELLEGVLVTAAGTNRRVRTNELGEYRLSLDDGTFDIEYSLWGFESHTESGITITEGDSLNRNVDLIPLDVVVVLEEDFESGANGWTHANTSAEWQDQWHLSTESSHSGTHAFKCGDGGTEDYSNLVDARLTSPVIDYLPSQAILSFWMSMDSEISGAYPDSAYDGGIIEIRINGGEPAIMPDTVVDYSHTFRYTSGSSTPATGPMPGLPCLAGVNATWRRVTVDLSAYAEQTVQFHFRFGSDVMVTREGWYIDDIVLRGIWSGPPPVTGLVVQRDGNDIVLSWDEDETPYYRIFNSGNPVPPFPNYVGTTDQTGFRIVNGLQSARQFYYVVGSMSN